MSRIDFWTAEAVSEGHPDKLADQISDAVLDAYLAVDPEARVACEVLLSGKFAVVAGEISATAAPIQEIPDLVREVLRDVGYNRDSLGFDLDDLEIVTKEQRQSREISNGVTKKNGKIGAGDQGIMFGYASNETPEYLPYPVALARRLMRLHAELRHERDHRWLWPDAKCQVTMKYEDAVPTQIDTIVFSTQHSSSLGIRDLRDRVMKGLIKPVLEDARFEKKPRILINPAGAWHVGGPVADTGLTGRKIVADAYGPFCPVGGGAFSGKDPTKVDRSGAYMARYIAKNVVAAGIADRCAIGLAYAIGKSEPVAIWSNCPGFDAVENSPRLQALLGDLDLTPRGIIEYLNLRRPIYLSSARFGHFGDRNSKAPWEVIAPTKKTMDPQSRARSLRKSSHPNARITRNGRHV